MEINEIIKKALTDKLDQEIALFWKMPKHRFSRSFRKAMKAVIYPDSTICAAKTKPTPKRIITIFAIIFISILVIGCTLRIFDLWGTFNVNDNGIIALLNIESINDAPKTIQEQYVLDFDSSEFDSTVLLDDELDYWIEYKNNYLKISFSYTTKECAAQMALNLENAQVLPREIKIGEYKGFYYESMLDAKVVIWDNGKYIFNLTGCNISENELISMAENMKKVE